MKAASRKLRRDVAAMRFGAPVTHVYNPLDYAAACNEAYIDAYAQDTKHVVFLGMNPGPYGMAQTGVPFGEVALVRDWMGIEGRVRKPADEHPKRPVLGFACERSEVSGRRLWGAVADHFGSPERFFARHYVANYCPLVFMEESGRNRTPDKLPADERGPLLEICDRALRRTVEHLRPEMVVGVGAFAEGRARAALDGVGVTIGRILHPSPASPAANRGWSDRATIELRELGVALP
jgi:single-strand selective monofunctional uracil DNA glycosylase